MRRVRGVRDAERIMRFGVCCGVLAALVCGASAAADTVHLKDGRAVRGKVTQRTADFVAVETAQGPVTYVIDSIERIDEEPEPVEATPQTESGSKASAAAVEEMLRASQIAEQLAQVQPAIEAQVQKRQGDANPEAMAAVRAAIAEAFGPEPLYRSVVDHCVQVADAERVSQALTWLQDPFISRMMQLAESMKTPGKEQELEGFINELGQHPPSPERQALIERLERATGATELSFRVTSSVLEGLVHGLSANGAPVPDGMTEQLESLREQLKGRYHDQVQALVLTSLSFAYRTVGDDELSRYTASWETETGQWYRQLMHDAVTGALSNGTERFVNAIAREAKAQRARALVPPAAIPQKPSLANGREAP